jgi:hypothetical protein
MRLLVVITALATLALGTLSPAPADAAGDRGRLTA